MEISPVLLFKLLLFSFAWGIFIAVINDINRFFRVFMCIEDISENSKKYYGKRLPIVKSTLLDIYNKRWKSKGIHFFLVCMQDVCLAYIYIIGLVLLNYSFNSGEFRFFSIPISALGCVIYRLTIHGVVFRILEVVDYFVKKVLFLTFYLFFRPLVYILTKIRKFFKKIYTFFQNSLAKTIKKRYNVYREKQINKKALIGLNEYEHIVDSTNNCADGRRNDTEK